MSPPVTERFRRAGRFVAAALNGLGLVRRGRHAAAVSVREAAGQVGRLLWDHVLIVFLGGMAAAGWVLLPVGLVLLALSLMRETVDRGLVGGLLLCAAGLLYLVISIGAVFLLTHSAVDRMERKAERLARQVHGED